MAIDRGDPNYGTGSAASTSADEISVEDLAGNFTGTDVETVLAEIDTSLDTHIVDAGNPHSVTAAQAGAPSLTNLASTSNGQGASLVGLEDSAGNFTATDVEAALAEVYSNPPEAQTVDSTGEVYGALLTADGANSSAWGQLVWKDIVGTWQEDIGGATRPTKATFIGTDIDAWAYSAGDAVDFTFHMPHDYAVGTDLYIHVHWGHNGTSISGNLVWDLNVSYASRTAGIPYSTYSTAVSPQINSNTISGTMNIANFPQHCHVVEEIQLSASAPSATQLDTDDISVDGLILVHVSPSTIPTIGGGSPNEPFLFTVDIHYQASLEGTKNKDPNFYT